MLFTKSHNYRRIVLLEIKRRQGTPWELLRLRRPEVALLRTNRMIRDEAVGVLYGQAFRFADLFALQNFLTTIGPENIKLLRHLRICGRKGEGPSNGAFALLAGAVNLEKLVFDYMLQDHHFRALRLWRSLHFWLRAYGLVGERRLDAGVN